jgi:ATP-dependent phosphoenolpyruvate carboxykinase
MPAVLTEVGDVGRGDLADAQPVEREQADEGVVVAAALLGVVEPVSKLGAAQTDAHRLVGDLRSADVRDGVVEQDFLGDEPR